MKCRVIFNLRSGKLYTASLIFVLKNVCINKENLDRKIIISNLDSLFVGSYYLSCCRKTSKKSSNDIRGLFNNYVTLKSPFLDPPIPHHDASLGMFTKAVLSYVTPDADTPHLFHLFFFFKVENKSKDTHSPMTHPPMF